WPSTARAARARERRRVRTPPAPAGSRAPRAATGRSAPPCPGRRGPPRARRARGRGQRLVRSPARTPAPRCDVGEGRRPAGERGPGPRPDGPTRRDRPGRSSRSGDAGGSGGGVGSWHVVPYGLEHVPVRRGGGDVPLELLPDPARQGRHVRPQVVRAFDLDRTADPRVPPVRGRVDGC